MIRELIDGEYLELDDWIERATKGLAPEAVERVREEIHEHYDESVAALTEAGLSRGAAELEAIKRLGSPYKARRGYLRAYPTRRVMAAFDYRFERYKLVRALGLRLHWREWMFAGYVVFVVSVYALEGASEVHWALVPIAFAVAAEAFAARIAARLTRLGGVRKQYETLLRVQSWFSWLITAFIVAVCLVQGWYAALAVALPLLTFLIYRDHRSWRKIRPFVEGS
jgi:hypothetical protein